MGGVLQPIDGANMPFYLIDFLVVPITLFVTFRHAPTAFLTDKFSP